MTRLKRFGIDPPDLPSLDWIVLSTVLFGTTFAVLGTAVPGA